MRWHKDIENLLANLGSTTDGVAEAIRQAKVCGVRNTVRYLNPVIRYVQEVLRLDEHVLDIWSADSKHILRVHSPDGSLAEIPLPPPVHEFLEAFNTGKYADLELPPLS